MKRPLIGIVPLVDIQRDSYWMLPGYMKGIEQAGGIPVMLPLISDHAPLRQLTDTVDGFLFTGGHDVSPSIYHEILTDKCGECCPKRDEMETMLLHLALARDKPMLGICRGIQFVNAALGGSLYQDLPSEYPSDVEHHQSPPYDKPIHTVDIVRDTPLYELLRREKLSVNSYHHQAVRTLSSELQPMAYSEDGLIEAVWMPSARFLWAVQWHPEFSFHTDENSRKIFEQFIRAAR